MGSFKQHAGNTNTATTLLGGVDSARTAKEADRLLALAELDETLNVPRHAALDAADSAGYRLPGAGILSHVGGALSALGLGMDVTDMVINGVTGDNLSSAVTNGLGVGAYGAGTLGAAGSAASTVAAPLLASGAAGMTVGKMGNKAMSRWGFLGESGELDENGNKKGRDWSEMAGDWGYAADRALGGGALGTAGGILATLGGSVVGTVGTVATAPAFLGEAAYEVAKDGAGLLGDGLDAVGLDSVTDALGIGNETLLPPELLAQMKAANDNG